MPTRLIRDSICKSESIDELTWFEEVFFYRLIVICDDYGRYDARPKILKADMFPLKDGVTLTQIEKALNKLSTVGMVQVYEYDQKPFLQLITWEKYQNVRNHKSKYPQPPSLTNNIIELNTIENSCIQSQTDVTVIQSESNPNPNTESESKEGADAGASDTVASSGKDKRGKFVPPTVEEVRAYCLKRGNNINAQSFIDYFTESNWIDSEGKPVRNWKQKIITWEGRGKNGSVGEHNNAGNATNSGGAADGYTPTVKVTKV